MISTNALYIRIFFYYNIYPSGANIYCQKVAKIVRLQGVAGLKGEIKGK